MRITTMSLSISVIIIIQRMVQSALLCSTDPQPIVQILSKSHVQQRMTGQCPF